VTLPHPGEFSRLALQDSHLRLPPAGAGQRIALFGGSFNPPHRGHRHVALTGLVRLALDAVWWMVTPGNPLKSGDGLAPLQRRIAAAEAFADHPRMRVTAFEAAIGTRYTAEAILYARRRHPSVRFVWLMGADNLATLHRWQRWRDIVRQVPVAVVDRPGASYGVLGAPAARAFAAARIPEWQAPRLALMSPPAWVFLHAPRDPTSSTGLRAGGDPSAAAS
jgi:nicotinate-nucleotide adenylyltransferase